jgi:hypothetical protein
MEDQEGDAVYTYKLLLKLDIIVRTGGADLTCCLMTIYAVSGV